MLKMNLDQQYEFRYIILYQNAKNLKVKREIVHSTSTTSVGQGLRVTCQLVLDVHILMVIITMAS